MTTHNNNKKENNQSESIKNHFEIISSNKNELNDISYLYGMTLEQYEEGLEIHSKCFDQIKRVKKLIN